jgi:hypothetical protein
MLLSPFAIFLTFVLDIFHTFFLLRFKIRFGLAVGGGGTGVTTQLNRAAAMNSKSQVKVLSFLL